MHEVFTLPLPDGLNEQLDAARGGWRKAAKLKREATERYRLLVSHQSPKKFEGKVWVGCRFFLRDFRRYPIDNLSASLKPVLDALVKQGAIKDDNASVIQSPYLSDWSKVEGCDPHIVLIVSDQPLVLKNNKVHIPVLQDYEES